MEDVALESKEKDLAAKQEEEKIQCIICGVALQDRGKHRRKLTTQNDKQIHLERSYGYCSTCLVGFSPPGRGIGIATEGNLYAEDAGRNGEAGDVDAISASKAGDRVFHLHSFGLKDILCFDSVPLHRSAQLAVQKSSAHPI